MRGIFFGATPLVAEIIHKTIELKAIVVERERFNKDMYDFAHYISAELLLVNDVDEVSSVVGRSDLGISYGFGLKFTSNVIDQFPRGLINIHTGDLPNYRGRHPISWAMIRGEEKIGVTIHQVDEKFDCGFQLHKFYVDRLFDDDSSDISTKIERKLATEWPQAIVNLRKGNLSKLQEGPYLGRIDRVFNCVDPSVLSSHELFSLARSQRPYGGVNIMGEIKSTCHIYNEDCKSQYEGYEIYKCSDGVLVAVK